MNSAANKSRRQALFADFSRRALSLLESYQKAPLVLLTGGLRTPQLLSSALSNKHADLLGIGRLSVLCPDLPTRLAEQGSDPDHANHTPIPEDFPTTGHRVTSAFSHLLNQMWSLIPDALRPQLPPLIGAGMEMARYSIAIRSLAYGNRNPEPTEGIFAVLQMWSYLSPGSHPLNVPGYQLAWMVIIGLCTLSVFLVAWALMALRQ